MKTTNEQSNLNITPTIYSRFIKRFLDFILSLIAIIILSPILLIVYILTIIFNGYPAIYKQARPGRNHKKFYIYKFRSMTNKKDENGNLLPDSQRITWFGKFLRKTSLDELPQLWNIFVGEMSFVGPRPVTQEELEKYGSNTDYILSVTPGLSGMWQISGRSDTGYEERINLDTYYIQNWSFWLDIWIIIKTVWVVIKGKGAY